MTWHPFEIDGVALQGRDLGSGPAVIFQHGLTGNEAQVAECFPADLPLRRLTLECRGHGRSQQGPADALSIDRFARDVLAFADGRGIETFVAGGISMGAAVALRLAHIVPERVQALILVRPAWMWWAAPINMAPFVELAGWLRRADPAHARLDFDKSPTVAQLRETGPDNLRSLQRLFDAPDPVATADLIETIARSGPGMEYWDLYRLRLPTLVVGHDLDAVHPLATAKVLADAIPGASLQRITPKAVDLTRYLNDLSGALRDFLRAVTATNTTPSPKSTTT